MLLSNVLQQTRQYLIDSYFFSVDPQNSFQIQVTPDERPFAYSGENVVTLFGESVLRIDPEKQSKKYQVTFSACVTKRVGKVPHDRQYQTLYYDTLSSLSTIGELLLLYIDSNNNLLNSINNSIITNRNTLVNTLDEIEELGSEGLRDYLVTTINGAGVIGPIRGIQLTARPIPRFADFFTAYNTKNQTENVIDDRIQPSGYSMIATFRGPSLVLPIPC